MSLIRIKAISFDNALDVSGVVSLLRQSEQNDSEYRSLLNSSTSSGNGLISIVVVYDNDPIAHVAVVPNAKLDKVSIMFSVISERYESYRNELNHLLWKKLVVLAERQDLERNFFADSKPEHIYKSMPASAFIASESSLLPSSALQEQIENHCYQ